MALVDYDPVFWPDLPRGASLFIHKLAVKRAFAGKGAADALFAFAEQEARLQGVGALSLDCHAKREKLRALYERRGFACLYEKTLFGKYATAFYQKEILPAGLL